METGFTHVCRILDDGSPGPAKISPPQKSLPREANRDAQDSHKDLGAERSVRRGHRVGQHPADDTSRFFGTWKATFPYNGQTVTMVSFHDSSGYKNYLVLPSGNSPAGDGTFSAANGRYTTSAAAPNNAGTYRFINSDTILCTNAPIPPALRRQAEARFTQARQWYERAVEKGDGYAMGYPAVMLDGGIGGPADPARAGQLRAQLKQSRDTGSTVHSLSKQRPLILKSGR